VGRPSKFKKIFITQAKKLWALGAIDSDLADFFGVTPETIIEWKKSNPAFSESEKKIKEQVDSAVEQSLYRRAMGYSHPDVDIRTVSVGDGCSQIVQTPIIKHYPPSEVACIFWLKNRQRAKWRDKQDVEVTGKDGGAVELSLVAAAREVAKKL
jgi:hypothetical protein